MDDALYGSRDKRGDWKPFKIIAYPPVFTWPVKPFKFARWLLGYPGFILPWNLLYAAVATGLWFLLPSMETMRSLSIGWISYLLIQNFCIILVFFGAFHLRLYDRRSQGNSFKYNAKWLANNSAAFVLGNQTVDNMLWTLCSGVPMWTAYEVLTLWAYANGFIPYVSLADHPIYFVTMMFGVVVWRDIHFYLIHRLIHWPPLYRLAHHVHHQNANPGPWSGLAMHPVEHLVYFSCVLVHWIVPSHPLHAIFNLTHAGMAPAPGHTGFDMLIIGENTAIDLTGHDHYIHHKYFECNYADGVFPFDRWFGTFNDGSPESQAQMEGRFKARAAKRAERAQGKADRPMAPESHP
jgi:sterol desaturase/sphingolipid hydroxylase (fatty acid hydroxylase superfamily)